MLKQKLLQEVIKTLDMRGWEDVDNHYCILYGYDWDTINKATKQELEIYLDYVS